MFNIRLKITKSKNSESLYIIKSFIDRDKKSTSRIIEKLETMDSLLPLHHHNRDEVITWARSRAAMLTKKEKEDNLKTIIEFSPSK